MEDENKEFVFEIRSRVKSVHIIPGQDVRRIRK